jgi:hypothetical protein
MVQVFCECTLFVNKEQLGILHKGMCERMRSGVSYARMKEIEVERERFRGGVRELVLFWDLFH